MPHSDLIDSLIATYRTLNLTIRPMSDDAAHKAGAGGKSVRDLIADLRERELLTSQQLKNMTLAEGVSLPTDGDLAPPPPFNEQDVRVLLSEFGTAREAILALVREMSDEQWDMERTGTGGTTTIRAVVQDLVDRDRRILGEIEPLVPKRA